MNYTEHEVAYMCLLLCYYLKDSEILNVDYMSFKFWHWVIMF
jgi:hypothetical protein